MQGAMETLLRRLSFQEINVKWLCCTYNLKQYCNVETFFEQNFRVKIKTTIKNKSEKVFLRFSLCRESSKNQHTKKS